MDHLLGRRFTWNVNTYFLWKKKQQQTTTTKKTNKQKKKKKKKNNKKQTNKQPNTKQQYFKMSSGVVLISACRSALWKYLFPPIADLPWISDASLFVISGREPIFYWGVNSRMHCLWKIYYLKMMIEYANWCVVANFVYCSAIHFFLCVLCGFLLAKLTVCVIFAI